MWANDYSKHLQEITNIANKYLEHKDESRIKFANDNTERFSETSMCEMKKVNVKICELIKYTINFYKNLGKMESIFNQYGITMNEELNTQYEPLTEQKAQEISQKDKENMQIYKNRNVENMKKICEIHKSLSSAKARIFRESGINLLQ